jgi:hypothetical protein
MATLIKSSALGRVRKLVSEWKDRTAAIKKKVARDAAEEYLEMVKKRIPSGNAYKTYKDSLEVFQIGGNPLGYGIRTNPKATGVKKIDLPVSVFFVQRARGATKKRASKAIKILEEFSPWTAETLPFMPKRTEAVVVIRKVRERDAKYIGNLRKRDRRQWEPRLSKAGVRVERNKKKLFSKSTKAVPDVAMTGASLEFGYGSQKAVPHWRPALRELAALKLKTVIRKESIRAALLDLNYKKWQQWGSGADYPILEKKELRQFEGFVKKVMAVLR